MKKQDVLRWSCDLVSAARSPVQAYLLGGTALVMADLQDCTGDLDFVVPTAEERQTLLERALELGFRVTGEADERIDRPIHLVGDSTSIDVFVVRTTHFCLTEGVRRRALPVIEHGTSGVRSLAPQDILLFKTATGRPGDDVRVRAIFEGIRVDWDAFVDEVDAQESIGNTRGAFDVLDAFYTARILHRVPARVRDEMVERVQRQLSRLLAEHIQ